MVHLIHLNEMKRPNRFPCRSDPADVANVGKQTFNCTTAEGGTGPTNNWADPVEMKKKLAGIFNGCVASRTMYVTPFCMGPLNSPYAKFGVEMADF